MDLQLQILGIEGKWDADILIGHWRTHSEVTPRELRAFLPEINGKKLNISSADPLIIPLS